MPRTCRPRGGIVTLDVLGVGLWVEGQVEALCRFGYFGAPAVLWLLLEAKPSRVIVDFHHHDGEDSTLWERDAQIPVFECELGSVASRVDRMPFKADARQ